jgi:hypothetical protein
VNPGLFIPGASVIGANRKVLEAELEHVGKARPQIEVSEVGQGVAVDEG